MCGLSVGVLGAARVRLIWSRSQALMKVLLLKARPRSIVMDSGTITGLAAMLAFTSSSPGIMPAGRMERSEEHTSELQSRGHLVCRLLLEKKKYSLTTNA